MKFAENVPLYLQVREEIENAILSGAVKEDEAIPSIRKLAQEYRLNPHTISAAVNELMQEEYLYKKRGIGIFLAKKSRRKLMKKKKDAFFSVELKKIVEKCKFMNITKEELMNSISRYFSEDEQNEKVT